MASHDGDRRWLIVGVIIGIVLVGAAGLLFWLSTIPAWEYGNLHH